jgi:hypothetical protein
VECFEINEMATSKKGEKKERKGGTKRMTDRKKVNLRRYKGDE